MTALIIFTAYSVPKVVIIRLDRIIQKVKANGCPLTTCGHDRKETSMDLRSQFIHSELCSNDLCLRLSFPLVGNPSETIVIHKK
jgi:hypothetical protein